MLVNRKAGTGRGRAIVDRAIEALAEHGLSVVQISEVHKLHDATLQAMQAGELRGVVSAGGDGTICAALNSTPPGTPLAVTMDQRGDTLARVEWNYDVTAIVDLLPSQREPVAHQILAGYVAECRARGWRHVDPVRYCGRRSNWLGDQPVPAASLTV